MGCGSSKSNTVVPSDAPPANAPSNTSAKEENNHINTNDNDNKNNTDSDVQLKIIKRRISDVEQQHVEDSSEPPNNSGDQPGNVEGADDAPIDRGPTERPKTASIAFEVSMEKPKSARKPRRLSEQARPKTPRKSAAEIEGQMRDVEQRRLNSLGSKKAALQSQDEKRLQARQKLENRANRAKQKMASKQQTVQSKREKELSSKTASAAQHDQKSRKARARRHEVAMQEASKMDTGGEVDNESGGEEEEAEEPTSSEIQTF